MKRFFNKPMLLSAFIGFLLGFSVLFAIHFINATPEEVHRHANFALYVNGERDDFDNFTFYEEVQACGPEGQNRPQSRVHMHDNVNHVVHVHDEAVTWGHFFANLGYGLNDEAIITNEGVFVQDDTKQPTFILNGEPIHKVANKLIENEDVLLVNYGDETPEELTERYESIPQDANKHNEEDDPAGCGGAHELSFYERARRAFGFPGRE